MKIELLLAAALATGLTLAAERGPHNRDDLVCGPGDLESMTVAWRAFVR